MPLDAVLKVPGSHAGQCSTPFESFPHPVGQLALVLAALDWLRSAEALQPIKKAGPGLIEKLGS